ncbi:MAG: alcohol dehydrogenase catalytic domain-containing protein [Acidobacteria bacterium]|nr:alcohol dehydrogenase catalytic domain-containing protein [Acidobacteriota bacterium]
MLAVPLVAKRVLEPREIAPPPDPGPGELLIRLQAVGICGSDLHWYCDGGVGHVEAVYPMVLGHEPVGIVTAVGAGVTTHTAGQRVSIEPSITCGHCEFCVTGHPNNCLHSVFMGSIHSPGFYRQQAVVPARNADLVPEGLTTAQASLIEPVAVLVHVMELVQIPVGSSVAVMGCGPIGQLCILFAKMAGASRIIAVDKVAHRLDHARMHGADEAILSDGRRDPGAAILEWTNGRGIDVVLDAAGAPDTIRAGITCARSGAQFVLIGIPTEKMFAIDIHTAMMKELRIQTIKRSNHRGAQAIELIRAGRIPESLITHRFPLEQTPEAFELLAEYRSGVGKILIEVAP